MEWVNKNDLEHVFTMMEQMLMLVDALTFQLQAMSKYETATRMYHAFIGITGLSGEIVPRDAEVVARQDKEHVSTGEVLLPQINQAAMVLTLSVTMLSL